MLRLYAIGFCATLFIGLAQSAFAEEISGKTVVATVGESEITIGHMIAMAQSLPPEQLQGPPDMLFERVRERLIQQEAMAQKATEISALATWQIENERRSLIASEVVEALIATIETPQEAIQQAYDRKFADFTPKAEFNASHIVVETEAEARTLLSDLEIGIAFEELARLKSRGPSGPGGGALGWFGPDRMLPSFYDAVAKMNVGETAGPVMTTAGWHVIRLHDRRVPSIPDLEDIREELVSEVWRARFDEAFAALIQETEIDRRDLSGIDPAILSDVEILEK